MDFNFTEDQKALGELVDKVLSENATDDTNKAFAASDAPYDEALWKTLAETGLLGLTLPESIGGSALGITELCMLLEAQGRTLAPVPLLASLGLCAPALAAFGSEAQQRKYLAPLVKGEAILTGGFAQSGNPAPFNKDLIANRTAGSWILNGSLPSVPYGAQANGILVPAEDASGDTQLFIIDASIAGITKQDETATNNQPLATLTFEGVYVDEASRLDIDAKVTPKTWVQDRALAALCALQLGVAEDALKRTAEYTSEREQFGRPIGSFQAVASRAADAYIDVEAMRATLWQAAWRLDQGLACDKEIRVAKYWAATGGHRVAHAAQHLHGGIGADREYPIHRYFLWAKQIQHTLGGEAHQLSQLGNIIAAD